MPLVEAGYDCRSENRDHRPAQSPPNIVHCGQGRMPGAEKKNAQNAITDDVAGLANVEMPEFEARPIHAKKKMQDRIKDPAGVMRREPRGRFNGDHDEPQNRGDPCLQNVMSS